VPGLKCSYGSRSDVCVLPQRYVNDTRTQCRDETDNCYNSRGQFVCFECFDKRLLIRNTQVLTGFDKSLLAFRKFEIVDLSHAM